MTALLKAQSEENTLVAAFKSIKEPVNQNTNSNSEELMGKYAAFFTPSNSQSNPNKSFELFSLIDHNIRVVSTSNTNYQSK